MTPEDKIVRLLNWLATPRPCKQCSAQIWFVKSKHGKVMPITEEGENHFSDCPAAGKFRKKPRSDEQ